MKTFSKILSVVLNALNYIVGILIVFALVIKADLIPILRIDGYTTLQQVFVSILAFELVIALAQGAVSAVAKDYGDSRADSLYDCSRDFGRNRCVLRYRT